MILAQYANSVNATEIMLDRQAALDDARQEVNEAYDPAMQVPLCESEHNTCLAYWQPIWDAQARQEQFDAGERHYALSLPLETCSTDLMHLGWRLAQVSHNVDTWRTIAAEKAAAAILEEKEAKPGLNVDDGPDDWWMANDDTDCEVYVLDARAI